MKDAISEVLETMFFMFVDFDGDCPGDHYSDCESFISLKNNKGRVDIAFKVREEFARMISANLLGLDELDVTQEDMEDTMKEFANMVGGNYKARFDVNNQWELGIPQFRNLTGTSGDPADAGLLFFCFGRSMGKVEWWNRAC
ncbi:MAG: chemotaxis protein CheX [Deltaproteobacteria bacterium]|nr:chemotaxis protein CheX [Deltaproteobacteria bacterium]